MTHFRNGHRSNILAEVSMNNNAALLDTLLQQAEFSRPAAQPAFAPHPAGNQPPAGAHRQRNGGAPAGRHLPVPRLPAARPVARRPAADNGRQSFMVTEVTLKQGQIWWTQPPEMPNPQPVLVIQSDAFNRSSWTRRYCVSPSALIGSTPDPATYSLPRPIRACPKRVWPMWPRSSPSTAASSQRSTWAQFPPFILESVLDGVQLVVGRS